MYDDISNQWPQLWWLVQVCHLCPLHPVDLVLSPCLYPGDSMSHCHESASDQGIHILRASSQDSIIHMLGPPYLSPREVSLHWVLYMTCSHPHLSSEPQILSIALLMCGLGAYRDPYVSTWDSYMVKNLVSSQGDEGQWWTYANGWGSALVACARQRMQMECWYCGAMNSLYLSWLHALQWYLRLLLYVLDLMSLGWELIFGVSSLWSMGYLRPWTLISDLRERPYEAALVLTCEVGTLSVSCANLVCLLVPLIVSVCLFIFGYLF